MGPDIVKKYEKEITHPMDFSTMFVKLKRNLYLTFSDFCRDINLVFSNCEKFNVKDPYMLAMTNHVRHYFRNLYLELCRRLPFDQEKDTIDSIDGMDGMDGKGGSGFSCSYSYDYWRLEKEKEKEEKEKEKK